MTPAAARQARTTCPLADKLGPDAAECAAEIDQLIGSGDFFAPAETV